MIFDKNKKTVFSGIQPTGCISLGNYIGALNQWIDLQNEYNCLYCIVDMHSITVRQDPKILKERALSFFAQYLACGLDPDKVALYFQSHVPEHAQLAWVLNCYTYIGELSRMTQFKDKSAKNKDNLNMGLMDYPVLMAADILLFQTSLVPTGIDQKQHVELTRDIANRFNNLYGNVFTIPEPLIPKKGWAKINSLQDPTAKMSKSDPDQNATVSIIDTPDQILKKFKRAVTDSDNKIIASENKPGITNLLNIYTSMTGVTLAQAEEHFKGYGYGDFKVEVADVVIDRLKPVKEKYDQLIKDKQYLLKVAEEGAQTASYLAKRTLSKVYKKIGFIIK